MHANTPTLRQRHDVIIVGAGPVGSLLAGLLGTRGLSVLLLEKRAGLPQHSMAFGITPPSLKILGKLGLTEKFITHGLRVRDCLVHGQSGHLGRVTFRDIPGPHAFVLTLPQADTIALLRERLAEIPNVELREPVVVEQVEQDAAGCRVSYRDEAGALHSAAAAHVVGCDGARSRVRELLEVPFTTGGYDAHFVMGDYTDHSGLGEAAHLFFTADGSVESFPLPQGRRRWIVQTSRPIESAPAGLVRELTASRTGHQLRDEHQLNQSSFTPRWLRCARYHHGRVSLCGDAAHLMSPIGGQGMNTGFADAEFLADALVGIVRHGRPAEPLLAAYERFRGQAARSAIFRAGWGMWLGTWRGKALSVLRDAFLRYVMLRPILSQHIGAFYAMLTIPYNTLERVPPTALGQPAT